MDHARAKELLKAIHACQDSGCEKECEAACKLLEADPELQKWFEEEMGGLTDFDEEVAKKFECCQGPEEQKAICKSGACAGRNGLMKMLMPAMAAAALFLVGFFALGGFAGAKVEPISVASSGANLGAFREDVAAYVGAGGFSLHQKSNQISDLKTWAVAHKVPFGEMTKCIASKDGIGCAVLEWATQTVTMVCLKDPACGGSGVVHVFVVDRSSMKDPNLDQLVAQKSRHRGLATKGWVDEDNVYLMVGDDPGVKLDGFVL